MTELLTKNNKKKGSKKHGFLVRLRAHTGRLVVKRRRDKGRKSL